MSRQEYIEEFALYLIGRARCPDYKSHGLTYDEKLKCERPALARAYELEAEK